MRITAQAKQQARLKLLDIAHKLFISKGFEATTTRDIANAAGIATGTLFNYFASKEALAMTLLAEALEQGREAWAEHRPQGSSLDETLFALIAALLRSLAPHRTYVGPVMATAMSPFTRDAVSDEGDAFRVDHLAIVRELLLESRPELAAGPGPSFVSMHLYWTLFLGVLAFWSSDDSPQQQDSLAVLDQSLRLFATSLQGDDATDGLP